MRRALAWVLSLGLGIWLVFGQPALAQTPPAAGSDDVPFLITADTIEFESRRDIYVARGNVRIEEGDQLLTADYVMFSPVTRQGVASGNVVRIDGPDTLTGDFIQFNIDTLQGFIEAGEMTSDVSRYVMTGEEVRKTGRETYEFKDGMFTTCKCPDPNARKPWTLKSSDAKLDTKGWATAKNTTFNVLGVPILWLPWTAYPLKKERQTGFLMPELNRGSRRGPDIGLPFFWAARHNINVLLTPRYLEKRGFKPEVMTEYVWGEESKGRLYGTFIHDDEIDPDDPSTPFDKNRWSAEWLQDWVFDNRARVKSDVKLLSDNQIMFDFNDFRRHRSDRFMESRIFGTHAVGPQGRFTGTASAWWADDLQSPDDLDRDEFTVQRLPNLSLAALSGGVPLDPSGRLVASMDLDYAYFHTIDLARRSYGRGLVVGDNQFLDVGTDGIPDSEERDGQGRRGVKADANEDNFSTNRGPEGDGVFQEGELIADRGHRMLIHPRLAMPFRIADIVEVTPEAGYHQTFYATDSNSFEERGLATARLDISARMQRRFNVPFREAPVTHFFEPKLSYAFIESGSQSDNPLFVPRTATPQQRIRLLDLDNIVRDPADRIENFSGFTLGAGHRFFGRELTREWDALNEDFVLVDRGTRLLADFQTAFAYEFAGDEITDLLVDGRFYPTPDSRARMNFVYDFDLGVVDEGLAEISWYSENGHHFSMRYRYVRDIPNFFEDFSFDDERFDDFEEGFERVNQITGNARWAITPSWALTYQFGYAFEKTLFLTNRGGVEYISKCKCWAARFSVKNRRSQGIEFDLQYTLIGLGDDPVRPFSGGGARDQLSRYLGER